MIDIKVEQIVSSETHLARIWFLGPWAYAPMLYYINPDDKQLTQFIRLLVSPCLRTRQLTDENTLHMEFPLLHGY